uniref:MARVEL domain containing 3 n=1 Tax=Echeneis naucrates TaxID=173247 RepID=A0A665VVZ8_ECHNA
MSIKSFCRQNMPREGRHHQRSDEYDDYESREGRGRNQKPKPRDEDKRGSGDRRAKQYRQREMTTASQKEPPVYRDHVHEGPSRLSLSFITVSTLLIASCFFILMVYLLGLCQVMELFVNLLIIICAGVPFSNKGGYRDLASLGGLYYYYYGGATAFTGADADRVKELDELFHQIKQPPYIFTMACAGVLMIYAATMFTLGIFRVPYHWPRVLLGEALLNFLIGLGYIPALAFYFIKLQETYNNPVCIEREQMYKSKGHKGFDCQFHGADIAGGIFGVLGVIVFILGAVLAVKAFRSVQVLKKERTNADNNL